MVEVILTGFTFPVSLECKLLNRPSPLDGKASSFGASAGCSGCKSGRWAAVQTKQSEDLQNHLRV